MYRVILSCALIFASTATDGARILGVFMTPSYSHQVVYQPVWKELSLRGHQVTVITPNPLNDPALTNLTEIDMSTSYEIWRKHSVATMGVYTDHSIGDEMKTLTNAYMNIAEYQLSHPKVQELIHDKTQQFDLLLVEFLFPAMYAFKDIYNCPMVGMASMQLLGSHHQAIGNPMNPAINPEVLMPFSTDLSFKERVTSTLFAFLFKLGRASLYTRIDSMVARQFGPGMRSVSEILNDVSLVLGNSNLAIHNPRPLVPAFVDIAGIHLKEKKPLPEDLQEFLDDATEGVIYFSLGTNVKSELLPKQFLNMFLKTFEQLPYKVLWKFENENLPNKSSNVEIRKWFPQQDVLGHHNVKLFITQGGIQSLDESIYNGVPSILIPFFGDQKHNAHHMTTRGGGLSLDYHTMTDEELKDKIFEVITNPIYKRNVLKLGQIASDQQVPALEKAVWWIEYVMRHDGAPHLKFQAKDMPFYQYYLLDVIAFMIAFLSVVLYVLLRIFKHVVLCYRICARVLKSMSNTKSHVA